MFAEYRGIVCGIIAAAVFVGRASAEEKEPVAVLEFGGAAAWNMPGGGALGPTASVEFEPIKDNLLIEAGITPFFDNSSHADWDFDLVFRHPFELSKKVEFEPGIGPSLSSSGQIGAVASFEFMIWPWQERKYGWFIDPSYSVSFAPGHQQSFGLAVGVLYGFQ
jgi:hypothetical protein